MVPTNPEQHTPIQRFRLAQQAWEDFGVAAERAGTNRSKLLGQFVRWYIRRQGAVLPERPYKQLRPAPPKAD